MIRICKQRGDTIVEVLLAMAVLSLILGGAYAASNRSLKTTRQTQERGEALKLVETQLEKLRATAASLPVGSPFCFPPASAVPTLVLADCEDSLGGGVVYKPMITRSPPNNYAARVNWDSIQGNGQDNVEIRYRL